jgi:hypothetical protein
VDPLFTGGIVPTVDDAGPQALAVHRGTIVFAGSNDGPQSDTEVCSPSS